MEFYFISKPGKIMEIDFRFWKIHKKEIKRHPLMKRRCSFLSSSISIQGYVYVIRSNFGVFHIFLYCDWNLVRCSQKQNQWELLVVPGMFNNAMTVLSEVWPVASSLVASVHVCLMPQSM